MGKRNSDNTDFYTTSEAASALGYCKNTIIYRIKQGLIKAHRIGKEYRISKSEIERITSGRLTDE